jgi:hypothetical protein
LRQGLTTIKKASIGNKEIRYNTEALKEEGNRERCKQMISDGLKEHDLSEVDIEERWQIIKKIIKDNAEAVLGFR